MSRTILITGSSRGIGATTALLAAEKGYTVCINYLHNEQAAGDVIDQIKSKGGDAFAYRADVSDALAISDMFRKIDRDAGPLSALVNNAGILEQQARVDEMDTERLGRVIRQNIISCFLCAKEAILRMSAKHGGTGGAIVNVSSVAAKTGSPNEYVDYAATKGAIDSFTIGLAKEVAEEGIRVNAVRPGFIYTDIHASGGEPGRVDRIKGSVPMKRGGQPGEVAAAILWLLSDEASYTTGSFIDIAGGR
jgi:NAD(P)-dependent dehydrogenase (short-subunit alcohol dehydrogenase family)